MNRETIRFTPFILPSPFRKAHMRQFVGFSFLFLCYNPPMNEIKIYLSGPIKGVSYKAATNWRVVAAKQLESFAVALDPMQHKSHLAGEESLRDSYEEHLFSQEKSFYSRDRHDCLTWADALLVNLYGADRVSIGTMFEIAWANSRGLPIVVVMEPENIHNHPFVRLSASAVVETLSDAVAFLGYVFHVP